MEISYRMLKVGKCGWILKGCIFIVLALFPSFAFCNSQDPESRLEMSPQKSTIVPKEFYISAVADSRKVKASIGTVVQTGVSNSKTPLYKQLTLKDGVSMSINRFISGSIVKNIELWPVTYNIKTLHITENLQDLGTIAGRIEMVVSFELNKNNEPLHLVEYKGGSTYTRSVNNQKPIEQLLAGTILNSISYFDKWINREVSSNEKLATKVNLKLIDFNSGAQNDTVFYSADKKLVWKDFKSRPDLSSKFAAEIFPFFSFDQNAEIKDGIVEVELFLKTYLVKSFSWAKDGARTPYVLNHEQRHFDIVKIITENFKDKIRTENLTVENYQGILAVEYLESLREMNRMQVLYDLETNHGINVAYQIIWDDKIDGQLKKGDKQKANLEVNVPFPQ